MKFMNIVVVSEFFKMGGLETQILGLVRHVKREGHRVSFVVGANSRSHPLQELIGDQILQIEIPPVMSGASTMTLVDNIAAFCRDQKCELLHLHPFVTLPLGSLVAARLGLPFVVTLHGPASLDLEYGLPYRFMLDQMVLNSANKVFCVSTETMNKLVDMQPSAPACHLPNGVDLQKFCCSQQVNVNGEWAVVARLDEDKIPGIQHFLDTFFTLSRFDIGGGIRVFGDGGSREVLEQWLAHRPYVSRVKIEGHCDCLESVLCRGFAGVAGMGRVVLESGAMGLPVILVGYDGVKGLVQRAEMDYLSECNFSGRGLTTIGADTLADQFDRLMICPDEYDLRPWIENNADETVIWGNYLNEIKNFTPPSFHFHNIILGLIERNPELDLFSIRLLRELLVKYVSNVM